MRRNLGILFLGLLALGAAFLTAACGGAAARPEGQPAVSRLRIGPMGAVEITFHYKRQRGIASNQFAVWIEDAGGGLVKTLYVTEFTALGGYAERAECLPAWVKKSGAAEASQEDIDAFSGATPHTGELVYVWDCTGKDGKPVEKGEYRFFVEGTLKWEARVLYAGTVAVGGGEKYSVTAEAQFSGGRREYRDMIGPVTAVFLPGETE